MIDEFDTGLDVQPYPLSLRCGRYDGGRIYALWSPLSIGPIGNTNSLRTTTESRQCASQRPGSVG